jgi:predicted SprT family Zn-dependent metalloprotease
MLFNKLFINILYYKCNTCKRGLIYPCKKELIDNKRKEIYLCEYCKRKFIDRLIK